MNLNWTLDIGSLLQILTMVCGCTWLVSNLRAQIKSITVEVGYLRDTVNEMKDVPKDLARHDERMKVLEKNGNFKL